ncbi:uncharacterized protein METZ01_LOCUS398121, partial [marine metagenome]
MPPTYWLNYHFTKLQLPPEPQIEVKRWGLKVNVTKRTVNGEH